MSEGIHRIGLRSGIPSVLDLLFIKLEALSCGSLDVGKSTINDLGWPHKRAGKSGENKVRRGIANREGAMRISSQIVALAAGFITIHAVSLAADRATLTGTVSATDAKPLEHATVMVYYAGVKKGLDISCPSCCVDCGKRVLSYRSGEFSIKGLAPDLWFTLLVVRDGYAPQFIDGSGLSAGLSTTANCVARDPSRLRNGRWLIRSRSSRIAWFNSSIDNPATHQPGRVVDRRPFVEDASS